MNSRGAIACCRCFASADIRFPADPAICWRGHEGPLSRFGR